MDTVRHILAANLRRVEEHLVAACGRVGRRRDEVTLVGVTKTVDSSVAAALLALGVRDLGEGRPQELWRKAALLPMEVRWHLVGHLQRNKIDRTLPLAHRLHGVDSLRLLHALDAAGPADVLLEFNCSGEESKHGFAAADLTRVAEALGTLRSVRVRGLMTMAAPADNAEAARPTFAALRKLRDELRRLSGLALDELSMGMSGDFAVAVEEGSTCVRLGTILFEGLP